MRIDLVRCPDILASVAALDVSPFTVGFAAETEKVDEYAKTKMQTKKLDMIIANRVGSDCGFDRDDNAAAVFWADGEQRFPKVPKAELANQLIELVAQRYYVARGADTQPRLTVISNKD